MSPSALAATLRSTWCRAALLGSLAGPAWADDAPLALADAMRLAMEDTPAAAADRADLAAAEARVDQTRADLLPDLGLGAAVTLGTGNVVAGALYPPANLPTVAGPPLDVAVAPGWQAQASLALRWDLLGLAARVRDVDQQLAARHTDLARADAARQARAQLAGLAWLDAAAAAARVGVAEADLDRATQLLTRAAALATAGVRPDVERSLAAADVAAAAQRLALARGAAAAAVARLRAGVGGRTIPSLAAAPEAPPPPADARAPAVVVAEAEAQERVAGVAVGRAAFLPRLDLLGAAWARGGAWPPGSDARVVPNWTAGLVLDVPLLDLPAQAASLREADAEARAARHRADAVEIAVRGQVAEAEALVDAARAAEAHSAALVEATRAARREAEARFDAGLLDLTTVAAALVREAEAELAAVERRFDVLRAALLRDAARGDLTAWTEGPR